MRAFIIVFLCGLTAAAPAQEILKDENEDSQGVCSMSEVEGKIYDVIALISGFSAPKWILVFKAVSGVVAPGSNNSMLNDPYLAWSREAPLNEDIPAARQIDSRFPGHYKSSLALNWERRNIVEVKLSMYDGSGVELVSFVFDGRNTNNRNWFAKDRLLSSPYDDVLSESHNHFSIEGDNDNQRRWFMSRNYGGCPNDAGWMVVVSDMTPACDCWEVPASPRPVFLYSTNKSYSTWQSGTDVGEASFFAIYVKVKNQYI